MKVKNWDNIKLSKASVSEQSPPNSKCYKLLQFLSMARKTKNFLKFALLCLSHFPELVPLSLISSSYCYIQPPKPTISDKIVDTMTFSTPYYYSFISFSLVKSTYLPPTPPPKKINNAILWFHELLAIYKQQWMGEAGLVNGLGCGRDSSIILNIVACYSLFQLLTLYPLCATHLISKPFTQ